MEEDNDGDQSRGSASGFRVEERPFSQSMANFLAKKSEETADPPFLCSAESVLAEIISEIDASSQRAKTISEQLKKLPIENGEAARAKSIELKMKLNTIKMKSDKFIADVLNGYLAENISNKIKAEKVVTESINADPSTSEGIASKPSARTSKLTKIKVKRHSIPSSNSSSTSVSSICSCVTRNRTLVNLLKKKSYKYINRLQIGKEDNSVYCSACDATFRINHLNLNSHIMSAGHLEKLDSYNLKLQQIICTENPNMLGDLNIPADYLWKEKLFIDPGNKLSFCGICRKEISYDAKAFHRHAKDHVHVSEKSCISTDKVHAVNTHDSRFLRYAKMNRIIRIPPQDNTFICVPCDSELKSQLPHIARHAESDEHQSKLNIYNFEVQTEIFKSNPDLFGVGRKYPVSLGQLRDRKLFVNPVAEFAYCGVCRDQFSLPELRNDVLKHASLEFHVANHKLVAERRLVDDASAAKLAKSPDLDIDDRVGEMLAQEWYNPAPDWMRTDESRDRDLAQNDFFSDANIHPGDKLPLFRVKGMNQIIDQKIARRNVIIPGKTYRCVPCTQVLVSNFKAVNDHLDSKKHVANLCEFYAGRSINPDDLTEEMKQVLKTVERKNHAVFVDPRSKYVCCVVCQADMTYSHKNIMEHISSAKHLKNCAKYDVQIYPIEQKTILPHLIEEKLLPIQTPGNTATKEVASEPEKAIALQNGHLLNGVIKKTGKSPIENSASSETKRVDLLFCRDCNFRAIPSENDLESHLVSEQHKETIQQRPSELTETKAFLFDKMVSFAFDTNKYECFACSDGIPVAENAVMHANSETHAKALQELSNGRSGALKRGESARCNKNPYAFEFRCRKKKVEYASLEDVERVLVKTQYGYRCVECKYDMNSIPMAYTHLRSCGHTPIIVDCVQYLREANYYCFACGVHIYGIKSVVEHVSNATHAQRFAFVLKR